MSAVATLDDLIARGISVEVQGTDLVLEGPTDILTDDIIASLRLAKAKLLPAVECKNAFCWDGEDWRAYIDERAAIREIDGGYEHSEADRLAFEDAVTHWLVLNSAVKGTK